MEEEGIVYGTPDPEPHHPLLNQRDRAAGSGLQIKAKIDVINEIKIPHLNEVNREFLSLTMFMWCPEGITDLSLIIELNPKDENLFIEFKNLEIM